MRILLSVDPGIAVPPVGYGGIERIVDSLARRYRELGHRVALLAEQGSTCPVDSFSAWPRNPSLWAGIRAVSRACSQEKPDILHSFSRLAYLLPQLPRAIPKVMSYQRQTGGRQITLAARVAGRTLAFTGCSDYIARMGRPSGGDWRAIPNFVDPAAYRFEARVSPDAPLVFLSRIESIKGPDLAIAIARKAGRRLILAGNRPKAGPELEFWNRRIAPEIGRQGVEWVGEVDDRRKNELLGGALALIVPIQWDEPFGIVFAEAFACGTPVITCRRGAAPEIVEEGRTGLFVTDESSGAEAVGRIGLCSREACRAAAEERFSCRAAADAYLALYQELNKGRRR